jgi:hypothetical protein
MRNIFIFVFLLLFLSCNKSTPKEVYNSSTIEFDTTNFYVDTIKVVKYKHLTSSNLYRLHCQMCHGLEGKGNGVKARTDTTICPYDLSKETKLDKDVYYIIVNGTDKMPNQYELPEDDVWIIVVYIKKFKEN